MNAMQKSFVLFKELGYDTSIIFFNKKEPNEQIIEISHIHFDGMNGFVHALKKTNTFDKQGIPAFAARPKFGFFATIYNRVKQYFRVIGQFSKKSATLRICDNPKLDHYPLAQVYFTKEETDFISSRAKLALASTNAYLLWHLNRWADRWKNQEISVPYSAWIVPAHLYTDSTQLEHEGCMTSVMEINIKNSYSPQEVNVEIQNEIKQESYWETRIGAKINSFFPDFIQKIILQNTVAQKKRIGTFSNLGRWGGNDKDQKWSAVPPVHPGQPLGVGAITYEGCLGLAFKLDPSLGIDNDSLKKAPKQFKEQVLHEFK